MYIDLALEKEKGLLIQCSTFEEGKINENENKMESDSWKKNQ